MAAIYFDMDGTIADLYGVDNWLDKLHNEDTSPYEECMPLVSPVKLLPLLRQLSNLGYTIGVISWCAKDASTDYVKATRKTKREWLKRYYQNVFSEVHIVKYGTRKHRVAKNKDGILFDDNADVRQMWKGEAYDATDILTVIHSLISAFNDNADNLIQKALDNCTMAYCYTALDHNKERFVKVGMTTRGIKRITEYSYRVKGAPFKPTDKEFVVCFPCKTEQDAYAMESILHVYFFWHNSNQTVYVPNDRFYNVPALREEMLREDGMLMTMYHKLGY